jgi:hypothetical protein
VGLLKQWSSIFVVHTDKELRSPLPGNSALNVDDGAVTEHFFVGPTVQLAVSPQPICGTSTHHLCGLLPIRISKKPTEKETNSTANGECQFPNGSHLSAAFIWPVMIGLGMLYVPLDSVIKVFSVGYVLELFCYLCG